MLNIKKRNTVSISIIYACRVDGNSKRYLGDWFFINLKKNKVSCTIVVTEGIQILVLDKVFSRTTSNSNFYDKCCIILNQLEPFMNEIIKSLVI